MATNQQRREAAKRKLAAQQVHRDQRAARRARTARIAAIGTVVVVVLAVVAGYAVTAAWNGGDDAAPQAAAPAPGTANCTYVPDGAAARPVQPPSGEGVPAQGTVPVSVTTGAGPIDLTLDRAKAPCAVQSFVGLAAQKYFENTPCHRLTTSPGLQVLQCGDPTGQGTGGPGYRFADEVTPPPSYGRGVLAMANSGPDTNGSQFFMIYGDAELPPQYTVFGTIGEQGLRTLDAVARAGVRGGGGDGPPATPVEIRGVTVG